MDDWPSVEFVFTTLLVTSFSASALVSLWAATSKWHWFLRFAAVFLCLSPLLVIPAHDPYLVFAAQALLTVIAIAVWKGGLSRFRRWTFSKVSISLSAALLITAVVAVVVPIVVRIPSEAWQSLPQLSLVSATFAAASLIAAWLVFGKRSLRRRIVIASILTLLAALPIAAINDWPNDYTERLTFDDFQNWQNLLNPLVPYLTPIWLPIVSLTMVTVAVALLLFRASREATSQTWRRILFAAFVALSAIVMLPPVATTWKLAHPAAIPAVDMPSPNGYDDMLQAGKAIETGSRILNTAVEPKSTQDLAAEVAKFSHVYEQIRLGLSRPCQIDAFPATGDLDSVISSDRMSYSRAAARALMREAELARQQRRFGDAARISIENIQLGQAITRGGLMIDFLVGVAIEGIAHSTLYPVIDELDADGCRATIDALERVDKAREPLREIFARDRIWSENAYGWAGHLTILLDEIARPSGTSEEILTAISLPRTQVVTRLLMVEIALRLYKLQHGALPDRLDELVPGILHQVPQDAFAPELRPLRYVKSGDEYLLYSVSGDRDDDGGAAPPADDDYFAWHEDGDLRLADEYAMEPANDSSPDDEESGK